MAVATVTPIRRGRPLVEEPIDYIEARLEADALKGELRSVGRLVSLQEYVARSAAVDCDPPAANAALIVLNGLRRVQRRYPDDAA